jgi:hypothetical protein
VKSLFQVAPNSAVAQQGPTTARQCRDAAASRFSLAAGAPSARNVERFPESGPPFLQTQHWASSAFEVNSARLEFSDKSEAVLFVEILRIQQDLHYLVCAGKIIPPATEQRVLSFDRLPTARHMTLNHREMATKHLFFCGGVHS